MKNDVKVICFDQGGTLLYRTPLKDKGLSDYKKIMEIAGISGDPYIFGQKLRFRDEQYKKWSLESDVEAAEEDIWRKWLLPDADYEKVIDNCGKLTLLLSHSKGERVFRSDAKTTVKKLHQSGYLIAIITNTVSKTLVPSELKSVGIWEFISSCSMSSITGIRKPKPHMFLEIASKLGVAPRHCAYIGDVPNRDVAGPKASGYGMSILLNGDLTLNVETLPDEYRPDVVISSLSQLLDVFNITN